MKFNTTMSAEEKMMGAVYEQLQEMRSDTAADLQGVQEEIEEITRDIRIISVKLKELIALTTKLAGITYEMKMGHRYQ